MVRLESVSEAERKLLLSLPCPTYETTPWVEAPPLKKMRLAMVTTAGLHLRSDQPFQLDPDDFYRVIPGDVKDNDLVMSHLAASFDRSAYQRDLNTIFPIDRLREMVEGGDIQSLADYHYSVSSAHRAEQFEAPAKEITGLLKKDRVNGVLLLPV